MLIPLTLLATALFFSAGTEPGTIGAPPSPSETRRAAAESSSPGEPPLAEIIAGGEAPDFSYQGWDGRWRHLHDVLEQGSALLVFGADDDALRALERERPELLGIGVVPVAVLDVRPGRAGAAVRRLGLGYSVLADPRRVIAAQFNVTHPTTGAAVPGWFVIDRSLRVRALERGRLPRGEWSNLARNALALPMPDAAQPAAR
jgi:peroxiredoxin